MPSFATATAFLSTFGVNTHSGNAGYANASIVNNSLAYLGFNRVRDDLPTLGTASAVTNALGAAGVKFDFVISSSLPARGDAALTAQIKAIENFAATYKGSVIAIEGLNEANIQAFSYNGSSSLAAAGAFQKALYGAVKSNAGLAGIPVINMSLGMESDADAAALGDLGKYSDFANAHAYTATGQQADKVMEESLARARRTSTGDPVVITETGYTTLASNPDLGVNQSAQAKLTLNAMLLAFENGSQQTYLYELLDSNLQPDGAEKEKHFGLFNADGTPKLAATAVHNLTTILGYTDAGTGTDASKASYTLGGLPSDGHSMVLTKASGAWDLVVWRDVKVWNDPLDKENVTEAKTITVDLSGVQKTVYVYDPLGGTKPIAVYTNVSSIQLAVGDRPLVVEVGAAGPVADLPPVSAPDLTMTAAQFAAQIDTLARSSGLKSVTLTDGKVIALASDATKDYVVKNYGALLGKIAGGGVSFKVTETGPNWQEERSFDAAGKLTSTTDLAFEGGVLKHNRTVTAAGDVTDSLYTGGKLAQVIAASNGRTVTTTYDVATGKVAELVDKSANGDVAISTYTRGILSGYTLNRADGSRTIDEFDTAGIRTKEVIVDAAGTWTTLLYGGGVVKSRYVQRRDGSGENVSYGITGQPFASVRQVIDTKGAVILVERARADGTLVSSEATALDGARTNTTYGATGNKLSEVIAAADGRRTTLTYDATSGKLAQSIVQSGGDTITTSYTGGVVTQLLTVRADGSRDTVSYDAQGRKTSDVEVSAANVWTTQQFDAASGKLTRRFVQNPDGSGENVSYGITGQPYVAVRQVTDSKGAVTLVERARADGSLVSSEAVAVDGAKTNTTYGATGNKLSEIVTAADGSRTTRNWDATTSKLAQSIVQSGGDTITTSYTGGVVTQLLTVRADGSRDTISYDAQGRKVSDVEVSAANVWTTQQFDAASGKLTRKFVQNPDGSGENVTYGIAGQPYVTQRQVTNAKGAVTLVERARADGSLVSSEAVAADGAKTNTTYGVTGNKLSEIVTAADGSRTTRNWDATSGKLAQSIVQAGGDTITTSYTGGVITQLLTIRANGSRDTISYDAQGRKTSDVEVTADKTWITQQFDAASGKLTRKFVQNADGTGENVTYGIAGQPYVTQRQVTNAKGAVTLVERARADGSLVSSEAVAVDGAKTVTSYGATGNKLSEIVTGADGSRTTRTWDATTGKLVQSIVQSAGDTMTTTYTGGVVTQLLTVRADGSRDTISYDTQGRKTTEVSISATRTWTTIQFDVATGNATRAFVQNADGTGENVTYGITGKSYATQRQVTDAQGKVVEVFRIHADGTLDYHERNDADGAREISNFDAAGLKLNQLNVHADGSRVTMTFTPDSQTLAQKQTVTAAGDVINATFADGVMTAQKTVFADGRKVNEAIVAGTRQIDTFAADGKKISAVTVDSANTWTTLLYDAAGKPLRRYVERADHSGEVTAYGITGKSYVTETQVVDTAGKVVAVTRLHADGSLDYTEVNAADGSSLLTYYDTAGRKTLSASIAANGDKFTTRLDAKSGAIVDTIAETPTRTIQSVYKGGKVETRVTNDLTSGDRIVETFDTQGRLTTKATTDAANNWETLRYDVASGAVSRRFVENADGSGQNFTYTGSGAALVTEWQKYDSTKQIVAGGQTRADGTRIVAFTVAGDGTRTSEWFDAADRRQSQVTAATSGAKTSLYFDAGSQLLVKSIVQSSAGDTITALYRNGVVTERTTQMANGAKMTESFSANGHDLSGVRALPGYQAFLFDNGSGKIAGTLADEVLLADGGGTTILTGGLGKDRFVIQRGASATITDFGAGHDLLDLSALTKGGQPTITLSEGNTIMRFGSGETVTLAGVDPSRLVASPQASGVYMLG